MIFDVLLKAFFSACGAGILTLIIFAVKMIVKKIKVDDMTIEALAHDAYFRHCRHLLQFDEIPEEELENHEMLYRAYKAQGLNGTGDKLHQEIISKKVVVHADTGWIHQLP